MRKLFNTHSLTAALALAPGAAFAHEGEHGGAFFKELMHVVTEPDHLAIVVAGAALIGCVSWVRRSARKRAQARQASARVQD
ncbi:HupE/UreJ family protein [Marinobacterium sp. YM272]|uniref:HupE/UreJ family protein n=1 Tax=Marinobacterium sp. YM272 TaxID=3421654 RepID=UPI003D7FF46E